MSRAAPAPIAAPLPLDPAARVLRRRQVNGMLIAGIAIIVLVALIGYVGPFLVDIRLADVGAAIPGLPPSWEHPLGTEVQGRDVLALLVLGTPQTLKIGLIAGVVGLAVGVVLGLASGYFGGWTDTVIRLVTDVFLTIPTLAILIVVASMVRVLSIEGMALIVASLAWMGPTRTIRSQMLTLRERRYVQLARLSGMSHFEIIFTEIMPNLIPFIAATLVLSVSTGILAAIGLEVLGLGPSHIPSLGMLIFWSQFYDALFRGMWWWLLPPIVVLVLIFAGLFMISAGLDRISNPRLRKQ
ncbi:MAG TPA: ABC transporter permease [Geminicoccaceae bacterium]|nr:ABC transporter permease [Geminicoccus sp.]HMU52210.1 ABC transporter permease [Geminicoccaceae bacterium]